MRPVERPTFGGRVLTDGHAQLTADKLGVSRGGRLLIDGLSFSLEAGQAALITGPNGSGKTSLLRVLAGLAPPAAGTVRWAATEVRRLTPESRARIAYRGHLNGLKKDLTVRENLEFHRSLSGGSGSIDAVLESLELDDVAEQRLRFLSAGQRRRAGLATLKLGRARLWLLDEPLTNLDIAGRRLVSRWVEEHLAVGGLAAVATHHADQLMHGGTLSIEL